MLLSLTLASMLAATGELSPACSALRAELSAKLGESVELHGTIAEGKISNVIVVDGCPIYLYGGKRPDTGRIPEGTSITVRGILHFRSALPGTTDKKGRAVAGIPAHYFVSSARVTVEP